ncbi:unnamed protein product [Arctia plantaginis]|uniref:Uncharacterized protein n=1 Tax=Arctia plantaginis TaxID=874455 RepID=A0A8S1AKR4_ARCPL|nr:unnamed protein product [Arctia plantaginis]CAB3255953.1 unnamed protein product [Arctia plantaginis]
MDFGNNMYVCAELRPLEPAEVCLRKRALRDAAICIGWLKFLSTFCYAVLLFLTCSYSYGPVSMVLKVMILSIIPLQIINGVLLFFGAVERKPIGLQFALWLILFLAALNTILGLTGAIYFIRMGFLAIHFFLSLIYALLAFSIFTVMCHDVIVIYTFKTMLGPLPPELACVSDLPDDDRKVSYMLCQNKR